MRPSFHQEAYDRWLQQTGHQAADDITVLVVDLTAREAKEPCCQTLAIWNALQETNISHLGKRNIIFKSALVVDMLVPRRVMLKVLDGALKKISILQILGAAVVLIFSVTGSIWKWRWLWWLWILRWWGGYGRDNWGRQIAWQTNYCAKSRVFKCVFDGKCFEDSSKHYHPFVSLTSACVGLRSGSIRNINMNRVRFN